MSETPEAGVKARPGQGLATAVAVLLLAVGGGVMVVSTGNQPELPVHGRLQQELRFTDAQGSPFSTALLRDKVWVASFIFTSCRDTCPCITAHMMLVQEALLADRVLADKARLVSFSVDPERDQPQALRLFAERYSADPRVWTFLTAEPGVVASLAEAVFRLPVGQATFKEGAGTAPEINHSERLCLVDGVGQVRGYYRPEPDEVKRLIRDIGRLVNEVAEAR